MRNAVLEWGTIDMLTDQREEYRASAEHVAEAMRHDGSHTTVSDHFASHVLHTITNMTRVTSWRTCKWPLEAATLELWSSVHVKHFCPWSDIC